LESPAVSKRNAWKLDARLPGNQRATLPHHAGLGNLLAVLTGKNCI
jgi:hypothetical protein